MTPTFDTAAWGRRLASAPHTIHMIGIGGVGMAGLAHILASAGHRVTGSELQGNPWTEQLEADGIEVHAGHDGSHVPEAVDLCIYTTAVSPDHPEALEAQSRGAELLRRGQVMAAISRRPGSVAISGTHGKTTKSSMTHFLLSKLGLPPDYFIGAQPRHCDRLSGWKGSDIFCFEADESDGTLVHYEPETAVITNIDFDHMEHHADEEAFYAMFQTFVNHTQRMLIIPDEDERVSQLTLAPELQVLRFGLGEGAGIRAVIVQEAAASITFRLRVHGRSLGQFSLGVPGRHNLKNALAALAVVESQGLDVAAAAAALAGYQSAERRMEILYHDDSLQVITDYAHHPAELSAVLDTVESWSKKRVVVVFQPHRYTRTLALKKPFASVLARADLVLLLPVYAASEDPLQGGTIEDLEREVKQQTDKQVLLVPALADVGSVLEHVQRAGDLILFLGAGDIDREARAFAGSTAWMGSGGQGTSLRQ